MDMIWNQDKMLKILESFYTLARVYISFLDLKGKEILCYPLYKSEYCKIIRANKTGDNACRKCDEQAFQQVAKMKNPYIYRCHAGLIEIVAPIITSEKERIGYFIMGQARPPEELEDRFLMSICKKIGLPDSDELKTAYSKLPVLEMDQGKAYANVLHALATYVWYENYFRITKEPLSGRVKNYISLNLGKALSLVEIAQRFKIGKTTLCKSVKAEMNVTVNALIRILRIEKAKQLLQSTELPISIIAEQIGIPDYNYFTKVFKKETGVTPLLFRKQSEKEYLNRDL